MREHMPLTAITTGTSTACRYCGSTDVRPSKSVYYSSRYVVCRCNACKAHFKVHRLNLRELRPVISLVLFLLLIVVFLTALYLSLRPSAEMTDSNLIYSPGQSSGTISGNGLNSGL